MGKFWGKQWLERATSKLKLKQLQLKLKMKAWKDTLDRTQFVQPLTSWVTKNKYKIIGGIGAVGLTVTISIAGHHYVQSNTFKVYHVYVGDEMVGTVSDPELVDQLIEQKYDKLAADYPGIHMELDMEEINFRPETAFKASSDDASALDKLEQRISVYAVGAEIRVDGELIGVVKDQATADQILEKIKEPYAAVEATGGGEVQTLATEEEDENGKAQVSVESVEFVEDVDIETVETSPQAIMDEEEVLAKLQDGETVGTVYVVKEGDCVSCIAYDLGISEEYIYSKNPEVKDDLLQIGQELDLTEFVPNLSVETVEIREEIHEVHYETIYQNDDTMRVGLTEVLQEGQEGKKQVTFRVTKINGEEKELEIIDEEILVEPVPRVVKQGTRVVSGYGTGTFSWPVVSPTITSGYGMRWGRLHAGLDMVSSNKNIFAADHGKVTFAGWKSSYGNLIIIDHGNGYETYYAHLSKISVSVGTAVEKGDVIGIMGTTGNSTGVHLHFEVHSNGEAQNPIKYLSS